MVRIYGKKPLESSSNQPSGIYLKFPSVYRLLFMSLIGLPLILGIWYTLTYLLVFWASETAAFLGEKIQSDGIADYLLEYDNALRLHPELTHSCDIHNFHCTPTPWDNSIKILSWTRRCNGISECWDGLDERDCTECKTSFSCPHEDGKHLKCLLPTQICDGHPECADMRDEIDFCKYNVTCADDQVSCHSHTSLMNFICVPRTAVCSGEYPCWNETYNVYKCDSCDGWSRQCTGPFSPERCITILDQCDGDFDCLDHRDELFFHCNNTENCPGSCPKNSPYDHYAYYTERKRFDKWLNHFFGTQTNIRCSDGKWYNPLYACDSKHPMCDGQCLGCMPHTFHCVKDRKCIPEAKVCDGQFDCSDALDEQNCTVKLACDDEKYKCNGFCDCHDCREEFNCTTCQNSSSDDAYGKFLLNYFQTVVGRHSWVQQWVFNTYHAFHCPADQKCISIQQRCDGVENCQDGHDEENCNCYECLMHPHRMYICEEGQRCFKYEEVCDADFGTRCPNATQLDQDHCNLLEMDIEIPLMPRIYGTKKKPPPNLPDQLSGVYLDLPSFRRLIFLVFVILPLILGIWYIWVYLLEFWSNNLEDFVESKEQSTFNYLANWDKLLRENPKLSHTCGSHNFYCTATPWDNDTKILPWARRCDSVADCWNSFDEENCTACLNAFSCLHEDGIHQKCIGANRICDGILDCKDMSDETLHCDNYNGTCAAGTIPCKHEGRKIMCLPTELFCSGEFRCSNKYAKEYKCSECSGKSRSCLGTYEFRDKCLPIHRICDNSEDCADFRDERFFHCNGKTGHCPGTCPRVLEPYSDSMSLVGDNERYKYWMQKVGDIFDGKNLNCDKDREYSFVYGCDGEHPECDGHCSKCMPHAFLCDSEKRCIPEAKVCDGQFDCKNHEDEQNCTVKLACDDEKYKCNGFCDCHDCREEFNCTACQANEESTSTSYSYEQLKDDQLGQAWMHLFWHAVHCPKDNKCISIQQRCNGIQDCSDGHDELGCMCVECMMHPHQMYICEEGQRCFKYEEVCDADFGTRCPNATQLDQDHCNLLKMDTKTPLFN